MKIKPSAQVLMRLILLVCLRRKFKSFNSYTYYRYKKHYITNFNGEDIIENIKESFKLYNEEKKVVSKNRKKLEKSVDEKCKACYDIKVAENKCTSKINSL